MNDREIKIPKPGYLGTIQVVLITLKLFNLIYWSWWLVLFPLWIELAAAVLAYLILWLMDEV